MACLYTNILLCKQCSSEAGTRLSANKAERSSILTGPSVDCSRSLPTDRSLTLVVPCLRRERKLQEEALECSTKEALKKRKGIKKAQINLI